MKRVTIITRQLEKYGGIERFVTTLARALSGIFEVQIVANYGDTMKTPAFEIPKNVKVRYLLPIEPEEISLKKLLFKHKIGGMLAEIPRRRKIYSEQNKVFSEFFKKLDTDIIITERADYSNLVKKYYSGKAKLIATDHNFHQNDSRYIKQLVESVDGFDCLVVVTKELADFYKKLSQTKVFYIPNALEKIPEKKSKLNNKKLVSVGRMVEEKDFPKLIDVMSLVHAKDPDVRLAIVGDGPEYINIEKLVHERRLENVISLLGQLQQNELEKILLESSLFVMSSKTEAFGLVLAEAMACGLPCVAFDRASGARAQIDNKTGVLIKGDDARKMANEIVSLLGDAARMKELQRNINLSIEKYKLENVRSEWAKLIKSIL